MRRKEHDEVQDRDDRVHHERERVDFSAQETKVQKAQDEGEQRDGPGRVNVLGRVLHCAQQQESGQELDSHIQPCGPVVPHNGENGANDAEGQLQKTEDLQDFQTFFHRTTS